MSNIVLDFRHNYARGEQLQAQEAAYQYDTGRILEAYVPETASTFFIHVGFSNDAELSIITTDSVTVDTEEGGYQILATIPDSIMAAKYGTLCIYIVASDGDDQIVTTYEGAVPVRYKAVAEDYVVPDEQATSIIERATLAATAAEAAQTAAESAQDAAETAAENAMASTPEGYASIVASIADAYSATDTYAVGDYVLYESQLYECTTAITTAEAWTAGHWTAVAMANEVSQLNADLTQLETALPVETSEGNAVIFDAESDMPFNSMSVNFDYVANGITGVTLKHGGKNLLPFTAGTTTKNEITFAVNADGSINFSGQASASFTQTFAEFSMDAGTYVFSTVGSTSTESTSGGCTIYVRDQDHSTTLTSIKLSTYAESVFTISAKTNIRFYALINSGVTVGGTFYPMICYNVANGGRFETYKTIKTYTVDWSVTATIYGGVYDPINGVLKSTLDSSGNELATPVYYDVASCDIAPFDGVNCIWANVGTVTVETPVSTSMQTLWSAGKPLNSLTWVNGSVTNTTTGAFDQSTSYYHMVDYIPITSGRLAVNCIPRFVLFYDKDKNYTGYCENDVDISKVQNSTNKYCRVVVSSDNYSEIVIVADESYGTLISAVDVLEFNAEISKYRYLAFAFGNSGKYGMYILGTNDLHHFNCLNIDNPFISNINEGVRDPAVLFYDGYYWFVYTPANSLAVGPEMGLVRTKDFIHWEEFENLTVDPANGDDLSEGYTWAPDFFKEGDDIYIVVSACTSTETQDFKHRIMTFDPDTQTVGEAYTTNLTFIDAHIYKEDGYYYALGAGGNLWKSDTLLSDEWSALSGTGLSFDHYEGHFAVKLDNGKWRVFAQNVAGAIGNAYYYYQDSTGTTFESGFGDRVQLTYDQSTKDACAKKWSVTTGYFWHFTIYDRNCWSVNNNNF